MLDHDSSLKELTNCLNEGLDIASSWKRLVEYHRDQIGEEKLIELLNITFAKEQGSLGTWIDTEITHSPIPDEIMGLWFGIFASTNDDDSKRPVMYFHGSQIDPESDSDWQCSVNYEPLSKYIAPVALQRVEDVISKDSQNYSFLDWILPLSYCVLTLDEVIRRLNANASRIRTSRTILVEVGYDDGDCLRISPLVL